jgi:hypothetical protein
MGGGFRLGGGTLIVLLLGAWLLGADPATFWES